jgi:hypothetical protein
LARRAMPPLERRFFHGLADWQLRYSSTFFRTLRALMRKD